ncbi:MAG: hypothetical protein NC302_06020 [Bacteroidales bacterium]|nr:hypothetical protein [Bacteroidales bacterium]MCM1416695.1 hypothetical protein [bacterium]MCM1423996.1 hypothetical protein [bacterium]
MDAFIFICLILLAIVLVMTKEYADSRRLMEQKLQEIYADYGTPPKRTYGAEELAHISMYYQKHPKADQIDDITWNDLYMDAVYQRLNTCLSAAGDEYLYYRLRTPAEDADELLRMEERIRFFMENEDARQNLQRVCYRLGRTGRHSIYEYLDHLDLLGERKSSRYFFWDALVLLSIAAMFFSLPVGLVCLFGVLCHNLIGYFKEFHEVEPYVTSFAYVRRMLMGTEELGKAQIGEIGEELSVIRETGRKMRGFVKSSYLITAAGQGSGNPLEVLVDYLRMLFYLDLIRFNKALHELRKYMDDMDRLITVVGQLECAVAVGSFRKSLRENWCSPKLRTEGNTALFLRAEKLYHPLLHDAVPNSLDAKKGVLLTGSNASGKSTFLRAVAVNALLAQTVHTCAAAVYEAPLYRIYSSMSLRDDLEGGDSYYMVEIKSIKRILDQAGQKEERPVLCFVDEVLRGTNTVERIAASTQIMKRLAAGHALCFAATHDIELTKLLEREFDNYHFEERIEENDIFFPYQLMEGPASTRNAIALLRMLQYDERITTEAEAMAKHFMREGNWHCV